MGSLVEGLLEQRESKQPAEEPKCKECGERMVDKGQKRKQLVTEVGEVTIEREYYWCPSCQRGIFPPG